MARPQWTAIQAYDPDEGRWYDLAVLPSQRAARGQLAFYRLTGGSGRRHRLLRTGPTALDPLTSLP
jgi:hypothetical protein